MLTKFTPAEIETHLIELNSHHHLPWTIQEGKLHKLFVFPDFIQAFTFMTKIAFHAEKLNHHPDWFNSYNKVEINLKTHEADGITSRDFELAGIIDHLISSG